MLRLAASQHRLLRRLRVKLEGSPLAELVTVLDTDGLGSFSLLGLLEIALSVSEEKKVRDASQLLFLWCSSWTNSNNSDSVFSAPLLVQWLLDLLYISYPCYGLVFLRVIPPPPMCFSPLVARSPRFMATSATRFSNLPVAVEAGNPRKPRKRRLPARPSPKPCPSWNTRRARGYFRPGT